MDELAQVWSSLPTAAQAGVVAGLAGLAVLAATRRRRRRPSARRAGRLLPRAGEIWFADVPFADGSGSKDRPVLVLDASRTGFTVACLTSQDKSARTDYVRAPDGLPGLRRSSWVQRRAVELPLAAFRRRAGEPGLAVVDWFQRQVG